MEKGSKKKPALPGCLIHNQAPAVSGKIVWNWAADLDAIPEPPRLRRVEFNAQPVQAAPQPAGIDEALRDEWRIMVDNNPREVNREEEIAMPRFQGDRQP